ncbi:hypothetical protein B840_09025 [Corynebacterium marinum DSM 44953]|uniref:Uncharacterized protein n=1 Tax=Corynebacterium marinum DSM 44953 TaxID=1224162 RepID=A0A0B6TNC9_9CORY|nr:hypothetical protein B840_09025 [Corynebacterium marinum DSM 44953]
MDFHFTLKRINHVIRGRIGQWREDTAAGGYRSNGGTQPAHGRFLSRVDFRGKYFVGGNLRKPGEFTDGEHTTRDAGAQFHNDTTLIASHRKN